MPKENVWDHSRLFRGPSNFSISVGNTDPPPAVVLSITALQKGYGTNDLMPTSTPWGPSQRSHEIAPGICFYSTGSHGGYHLSLDRFDTFRQFFPDFTLWAGDPWFEEDCDSALVTIT